MPSALNIKIYINNPWLIIIRFDKIHLMEKNSFLSDTRRNSGWNFNVKVLNTHVGTTAMSKATVIAFGRFAKYNPQIIMNLIDDNLFSVWSSTFNYCELNNHFGFYIPAESARFTVMSVNQEKFIDVTETEFGIIITQLLLVILLKSVNTCEDADIDVERMKAHFEILHDYSKQVFSSEAQALYELLVTFYQS